MQQTSNNRERLRQLERNGEVDGAQAVQLERVDIVDRNVDVIMEQSQPVVRLISARNAAAHNAEVAQAEAKAKTISTPNPPSPSFDHEKTAYDTNTAEGQPAKSVYGTNTDGAISPEAARAHLKQVLEDGGSQDRTEHYA